MFLNTRKIILIGFLSIMTQQVFATGGFWCSEIDPETKKVIDDGMYLHATTSWSFGDSIVGKPQLKDPGHTDIPLNVAQYKNDGKELYLLSVMDLNNNSEIVTQRKVELVTKRVDENVTSGTLTISYTNSGIRLMPIPVVCTIE